MFRALARPLRAQTFARQVRFNSTQLAPATVSDPAPTASPKNPYFVRRNTHGAVPVYTDIRNGGTRYLVLISHVEGNRSALADDIAESLFPAESEEAHKLKVHLHGNHQVIVKGGRWKREVTRWLVERGF
ncbi:mitochondrial large subunit ribosomal protein-domain-containing protein [Epithele typhae]|uniref:mitochondrial large subunit ribosomal protein-domain-containing protein n=1 Tax=Epithele typhae TaxID=378194 RepID=UPI00200860A2|nr:mitochondrial large subunit ribosomal protein-domain-containing protein [Epithele typhae]KAH9946212.1 mitochondrial large subunit ribosomal protein-domain-containing protein [Epithele typhae]